MSVDRPVLVVGGGLAGCEAALQLARRGVPVRLFEMKPGRRTAAQSVDGYAELVCSNSLRAADLENAVGVLKEELRRVGGALIRFADATRVPAGGALAVDRERFSAAVTAQVRAEALIECVTEEVEAVPGESGVDDVVIATGPLTTECLAEDIRRLTGAVTGGATEEPTGGSARQLTRGSMDGSTGRSIEGSTGESTEGSTRGSTEGDRGLYFYDAIAPILSADSIDESVIFRASRYGKGDGDGDDYLNCPLSREEYEAFTAAVARAEKVTPHAFEESRYFEGCLPIEVLVDRGPETLRHGCMKPVGLVDPRTGKEPYAVVQLRAENLGRTAYNMVGFQTRMTWSEQVKVFRTVPGLSGAEFLRLGSIHRNTYIDSPSLLDAELRLRPRRNVRFAGQITGVEGYVESMASGFLVGVMIAAQRRGVLLPRPPKTTTLGALLSHTLGEDRTPGAIKHGHVPSNVHWGLCPPPPRRAGRRDRRRQMAERALFDIEEWWRSAQALGLL